MTFEIDESCKDEFCVLEYYNAIKLYTVKVTRRFCARTSQEFFSMSSVDETNPNPKRSSRCLTWS